MKEKNQYIQMQNLGDWLQDFINQETKDIWNFTDLAKRAVELLDIDYKLPGDEISTSLLEHLSKNKLRDKTLNDHLYATWLDSYEIHKGEDISEDDHRLVRDYREWKAAQGEWVDQLQELYKLLYLTDALKYVFTFIKGHNLLWTKAIVELHNVKSQPIASQKRKAWYSVEVSRRSSHHLMRYELPVERLVEYFHFLVNRYGGVIDTFIVKDKQLVKTKSIAPKCKNLGEHSVESVLHLSEGWFPWDVVLSRICLDFFSFGGQDYFGFCDYCGKFFIVQRKGRKRFCGDICRVNANQKERHIQNK